MGPTALPSTPMATATRAMTLAANPKAAMLFHWKSLAPPGADRRADYRKSAPTKPMPISPRAVAIRELALGPATSRAPFPIAPPSKTGSRTQRRKFDGTGRATTALLDGFPDSPGHHRILGRPTASPASSPPVYPCGGRLDRRLALSMTAPTNDERLAARASLTTRAALASVATALFWSA